MRTAHYEDILRLGCELAGEDFTLLSDLEGKKWRGWIGKELETSWEYDWWPELMRCQERYFRDLYAAATAYSTGAEVYYPTEGKYYHAIRASTGNAPTNVAYWAESKKAYTADDYSASTAYVAGNQVYYDVTDAYYQCHTATTGNAPTDTTKWGPLVPFDAYVSYDQTGKTALGEVRGVYDKNPRVYYNATELDWALSSNGVQVYSAGVVKVWVDFRIRPPRLYGDTWSSTSTYTGGSSQAYFTPSGSFGNYYDCITTTSAGESPSSASAKWSLVEIPYILKRYLSHAAYVRWLRAEGQVDKATVETIAAMQELMRESKKVYLDQGQVRRSEVLAR